LRGQAERSSAHSAGSIFPARVYAEIGEKDKALEYLEKTCRRREHWMAYLQFDPRLDNLRGDPRFEALVRRLENK
jgi:hypothetical protein